MEDVPKVEVPTLVIQNRNDPWTKLDMVQSYFDALKVPKDLQLLDLKPRRLAAYDYIGSNPEVFEPWFAKYDR